MNYIEEEDAATASSTVQEEETSLPSECGHCSQVLEYPFIRCAVCSPTLCICKSCFTLGVEFVGHENDHPYSIVKYEFSLFDDKWTASEEIKLLDAIIENGFGNWPAISKRVKSKTAAECENHYIHCYIDKPPSPLPEFPDDNVINHGAPLIYKLSDDPPRPAEHSATWQEMGGYSASRGDFNIEYDNFVEMDICYMNLSEDEEEDSSSDDEAEGQGCGEDGSGGGKVKKTEEEKQVIAEGKRKDKELYREMKCSVLDVYRNVLVERQWRKNIVRDYGLINIKRWYGRQKIRFEKTIHLEFLRPFMRLFPAMTFDKYLESLLIEKQLKTDISRLQDCRKNGLTTLKSIRTFHMLKQRRESTRSRRHLLQDVLNHINDELSAQTWLVRQAAIDNPQKASLSNAPTIRKPAQRLDIVGMPGYDKLNFAERELCSESRLVPKAYLDFSKILIAECNKIGHLKLAHARPLIKIDVNKTRKMYDFLILHGHINKDPL